VVPRDVREYEPMPVFRWVLHLDLDQFIAAVEIRRRPELRGRPVVVGGDGDPTRPRQVVATASSEARRYGVRSGMPMRTALRRCPEAVFLPSDHAAYEAASAEVWAVVRELPVTVGRGGGTRDSSAPTRTTRSPWHVRLDP
jgi:DNA polymerase-4